MRLLSLSLKSFRNYSDITIDFENDESVSVLVGENATGKTNVLEAISVLALLKSAKKVHDSDLISWDQSYYRIKGKCRSDKGEEIRLEVVSQIEPKKSKVSFINDVRTKTAQYIGTLPLITFTPDDLTLFTGAPSNRRKLIDVLLCQVSPTYLQAISEYEKFVRQRNVLLRHIKEGVQQSNDLDVWDEKIAILGAVITLDRLQLFEALQMTIVRELTSLGEKPKQAEFRYTRKSESKNEKGICDEIIAQLKHDRERDILILSTTTGPHRDDWSLSMDGRDITSFASRGQQRAAILALLLLQASFLEIRKGEKPVLLLDDVFSEFDAHHRAAVLKTLAEHQVIITAVEIDEALKSDAHVLMCPL